MNTVLIVVIVWIINSVFEIKIDDETVQMTITQKQKKLLYDFFDTY